MQQPQRQQQPQQQQQQRQPAKTERKEMSPIFIPPPAPHGTAAPPVETPGATARESVHDGVHSSSSALSTKSVHSNSSAFSATSLTSGHAPLLCPAHPPRHSLHHHHLHQHSPYLQQLQLPQPLPPTEGSLAKPSAAAPPNSLALGADPLGPQGSNASVSIEQLFEDSYSLPLRRDSRAAVGQYGLLGSVSGGQQDSAASDSQQPGLKGSRATNPVPRAATALRRIIKAPLAGSSSSMVTTGSYSTSGKALSFSCFSSSSVDPPLTRKKSSSISSLTAPQPSSQTGRRGADADGGARQLLQGRRDGGALSRKGGSGPNGAGGFPPQTGVTALKDHEPRLTERERAEIKNFRTVYFLGQMAAKKAAMEDGSQNEGFDDKDGFYICKPHDHILYRYEIHELLGKGTFGQVVKALDHRSNTLVAMKIVKNERPFLRQAKEEVRILEVLRKQDKGDGLNIVHILDSFKWRGHACISFELLGISLHQLLKKTRGQGFSLSRIQRLTKGILRCLEALAKNRIIHCDIKPENILLRRSASGVSATQGTFNDNSIKVIDFGSSCYEQQQIYTYIQSRYYRAPEVIMGARYTCAIDMWSLACVIGELYTAHPLFAGDDEHDQLAAIMEVLDLPPVPLIGKCKRADKFFNGRTPRYLNQIDKRKLRGVPGTITLASALKENEDSPFLDFMQRALQWDPSARMTASEGLHHPWILRGHGGTRAVGDKKMVAAENARSMERVTNTRAMVNNFKSIVATGSVSSTMGSSGNSTLSSNSSSNFLPFPTKLPISKRTSTKMGTNLTIPRSDTAQMGDGGSKALHTLAGGRAFTVLPGWDAR